MTDSISTLQVRNLVKGFRKDKELFYAVKGISFEVKKGECFGLLGPNGAGKSTSINCIIGYFPPTDGQVLIEGFDVHKQPKSARALLGVCSQEDTLDTDFKVIDQLVRHATFFKISLSDARIAAAALLEKFKLTEKSKEPVEALSGGMRRRLQVARALISDPQVLILDEPTTGLDPDARRTLWEILEEYRRRGLATVLSTHYMEEAERLCDRIALLYDGKIIDIDTPAALVKKHVGTELVEEQIRPGVVWKRPPNLEDVFLKMTGVTLA